MSMNGYLQNLEIALRYYDEADMKVDFENGNLIITDEELLSNLRSTFKSKMILEAMSGMILCAEIII